MAFLMCHFDRGEGPPVVLIPGVQGRWEWMRPALDALARRCRAISYSLIDTRADSATALDDLAAQIDAVLDRLQMASAAIAGVSFGGLIAVHYAAARPRRTNALILASAPSPSWMPSPVQRRYMRTPWISGPLFAAASARTLSGEIAAAIPQAPARVAFYARQAVRIGMAPACPGAIARRAKMFGALMPSECARITAPSLVVTGEPALDRVIPVQSTREYLTLIPGAEYAMMKGTGHLGLVTTPESFAQTVGAFVARHS